MSTPGKSGGGGRGYDRGGRGGPGGPRGRGSGGLPGGPRARGRGGGGGFRGAPRGRGGPVGPVIFAEGAPAQPPPRLTDSSHSELITAFKSLKVKADRPLRPGYGTLGNPITLRANFFPVRVPKGPIFDYNVEITPKTDINRLKIRIFQLLELSPVCTPLLPYIAHDRSQRLVAARKLPQPLDIQVPFYDDHETGPDANAKVYNVSIKFERELDTSQLTKYMDGKAAARDYDPLPLVSALNLVLQQHASRNGVRVGKNRYFFPTAQRVSLGPGVEAVQGFYTSVRPTYKQLMVNVNVCMTAFIEPGNLADALLAFQRNSRGAMPTLPKSMSRLRIRTQHLGHKKAVKRIGTTSARITKFDCPELGGTVSVEQYFLKKYNRKLKYPADLPVVDIGGPKKTVWVPAELCDIIPGQPYGKLNDKETAQMIRYACNPPRVNAEAIVNEGFPTLGLAPVASPINGFGVSIDTEMAVVPARELPPPRLSYRSGGKPNVSNGSWNILDVTFHRGAQVASWWVVVVRDGEGMIQGPKDPNLGNLVNGFAAKCTRSGMVMPSGLPRLIPINLPNPNTDPMRANAIGLLRTTIKEELAKKPQKPSFILVLLENRDNFIYPAIKRIGDMELGVHTVHMQLSKALNDPKKQDQYFSNVALKVNTKLGGMNHLLDDHAMRWLTKKKTMMVGIDVTHPGPGSREGTPSIAAVVANVDDSFVQFPASLRIQQSKKEMLDELRDMLVERLLLYEKKNRMLPQRIFVFRDGVSEGQFDVTLQEELPQILEAFKRMETKERKTKYRPQLSIVICGKRHHARFYPTNSAQADRNGNTRPGTVVDKGVTAVFDFDFYLQAHAGLQGHVKATHYTVVYDENSFTADEIQQGTHDTSYLYARATKAVSLIPPAYYADLACERGRCYLNDFVVDDKTSVSGRSKYDRDEEMKRVFSAARDSWGTGLHPDVKDSMFYI
ncbi:Protein argonaute 1B [Hypsizygus marmoreus]|uniref:Protein argonaute 1B n=1 Tax=Hypsizygus marmoreus TaxID=39966 RepID=A0A369JKX1_HYPMA|nr:Protein argonaute 1B [Hypsizygus marmoreus]